MIYTNPVRRVEGLLLEDYEAPLADYLGAVSETASTLNPGASLGRLGEIEQASGRAQQVRESDDGFPLPEEPFPVPRELSPLLSPEEATDRAANVGLKFDKQTRSEVVDILIQRKREEVARQSIERRGPTGFGAGSLAIATELLVTATDPLNLASAFIPVVGEVRFLQVAGRIGATLARGSRGAVEGAVGAAVVEPFIIAATAQEQADYDMMDSLLNVAFGTALGGGLHVAGGAVGDALARRSGRPTLSDRLAAAPHEVREAALRTAVGQAIQGRQIDVEPILTGSRLLDSTSLATRRIEFRLEEALPDVAARSAADFRQTSADQPATLVPVLDRDGQQRVFEGREQAQEAARKAGPEVRVTQQEDGGFFLRRRSDAEPLRDPQGRPQEFKTRRQAEKFIERTAKTQKESFSVVPFGPAGGRRFAILRDASPEDVAAIESRPDLASFADTPRSRFSPEGSLAPLRRPEANLQEIVAEAVAGARDPRNVALADFRASERAEEILREIPIDETAETAQQFLDDALEQADELRRALDMSESEFAAMFAAADEEIAEAQALGRAARAAALCELRA
ncbi:hypothetical protein HBA54_27700 [Pelagibius litoralis]|uniref:DdrB-like domain-containing protein n=1 Tax=Pelagibius litoralis TaxID=374515 RepID=A0A967F363_9PROT|nr:hypothetical protein [Pelagibius litoralis]NIA72378.1 hypothetical protein [Pelagibius litoralis]